MQSTTKNNMENEYFAEVKTLKHGFNVKRIGYKWGLYNDEGTILMRPLYDYISIDQEGRIWARYKGEKFFVEENKLPYQFDFIHDSEIDKEWYVIESNGYLGVIDKQLNIKIPLQYKYIIDHGGVLWCSNEWIRKDTVKGLLDYLADCLLFSYEGNCITEKKYDLHFHSSTQFTIPSFPIIGNKDGFNILNNDKKVVLPTLAKIITKSNDWLIIEFEKEQLLYNIEKNCFINNHKYSKIDKWKSWIKGTNVFICKRLSDERTCDVYKDGKLIATFDSFSYSLFDVADEFIVVWGRYVHKYGFANTKGLVVPCLYDRIIVHNGAVGIVDAEVFEETSSEYKENAIYIDYNSSRIQNFYVTKGRFDVFGFDGRCICEDNDIIKSSLLWDFKSDIYFIKRKYIEWEFSGKERIRVDQYDSSGRVKCIYGVKEANWDVYNHKFNIKFEDGSSVSHPASASHTFSLENEKTENIKEPPKIVYSAIQIAVELLSSDYSIDKSDIGNISNFNNPKNNIGTGRDSEGFSPTSMDGKWGYINENGDMVIPFEYDETMPFSDGLAAVKKDGLYGYIDYNNKVIINFQFVEAGPFIEGLAKFDNNPMDYHHEPVDNGFISKDGFYCNRNYQWRNIDSARAYDESNRINYEKETWWAMTDGMYGDYPGTGVDYDTIGFGI